VYYVPAGALDGWVRGHTEGVGEQIIAIRPATSEERDRALAEYRGETDDVSEGDR
jgi:hypothetical protein